MCKRIFAEQTSEIEEIPFYKIGTLGGSPDAYINRKLFEDYRSKYNFPKNGEVLVTCSGTVGKCIVFDGTDAYYQDSNIVWIDNPTLEITNGLLYYILSNYNWGKLNSTTIARIYGSDLRNLRLRYPKENVEQKKIVALLSLLDNRISTQSKTIEALKTLKIAFAKKIFTQQLRFKDDNGKDFSNWEFKKLGDVTLLVNKRNNNNEKLPVYSINNKMGFVPQSEQFEGVDSDGRGYDIKLYKIIGKNTFAYNPARINVGSIGYSRNLENIIISSLYVCFKTKDLVKDEFLFQYLKTNLFNREVLRNVEGGVRDYLFYENFARIKFDIPSIEEQQKIAKFLSSIDSKIDTETHLLQKLKEQKKYLLQNLFV